MELFYPVYRRINQIANEEQIQENGNQLTFLQLHHFFKWKWIESNALVKYFQSYFKIVFLQALLMQLMEVWSKLNISEYNPKYFR